MKTQQTSNLSVGELHFGVGLLLAGVAFGGYNLMNINSGRQFRVSDLIGTTRVQNDQEFGRLSVPQQDFRREELARDGQ